MLPVETILALFPRPPEKVRLGLFRSTRLHPITLARAAAMEALGCGLLEDSPDVPKALLAAWVMAASDKDVPRIARGDMKGAARFVRRARGSVAAVIRVVSALRAEAVAPFIPPKKRDGEEMIDDGMPRGNGWPLEVAEALCAHYGWTWAQAINTEVQVAVALLAVGRAREGGEAGGPNYYDRIRLSLWKRVGVIPQKGEGGGNG
jgi:hypothetical protein